jgi:hypothetical protein
VVLVGCTELEVDVAVEFDVPLSEVVVVCPAPVKTICVAVDVELVAFPVNVSVPIAKMVVDPRVVVRVLDLVVIVDSTASVVTADEEVETVMVVESDR